MGCWVVGLYRTDSLSLFVIRRDSIPPFCNATIHFFCSLLIQLYAFLSISFSAARRFSLSLFLSCQSYTKCLVALERKREVHRCIARGRKKCIVAFKEGESHVVLEREGPVQPTNPTTQI